MNRRPFRAAVIGGGISGLASAYYLNREARAQGVGVEVSLLERSARLGGVIGSRWVEEFLLEGGPENFVSYKPQTLELIRELNLEDQVIGSNDDHRRTFILNQGRLEPLPDGMEFLVPVRLRAFWATPWISAAGKLRAFLEPVVSRSQGELSVYSFFERRVGKELTDKVVEPLVSAIYGGDVHRLSVVSALRDLHSMEQKWGSLWRGMRRRSGSPSRGPKASLFLSLRRGMSDLVAALEKALSGVSVHKLVEDLRVENGNSRYRITGSGFEEEYDLAILATPSTGTAELLQTLEPSVVEPFRQIPYSSTQVVYLAYRRDQFSHPLKGFGFVVPCGESNIMDACTWVSSKFEGRCPADSVLLRCSITDGRNPRSKLGDAETAELVHTEIQRILKINCTPTHSTVFQVPDGMPQPNLGHDGRLNRIQESLARHPGLWVTGAYYRGVGIPDCIGSARQIVTEALHFIKSR